MNPIINAMAQRATPVVLVLDDFHVIQASPSSTGTILIERLPPIRT